MSGVAVEGTAPCGPTLLICEASLDLLMVKIMRTSSHPLSSLSVTHHGIISKESPEIFLCTCLWLVRYVTCVDAHASDLFRDLTHVK